MLALALWSLAALAQDTDNDGVPDASDTCPATADATNLDSNGDGWGDACAHPSAQVDASATLEEGAYVGARAIVGAGARLGVGATVGRRAEVEAGARIGAGGAISRAARVGAGAIVGDGAVLGYAASVGPHAVLGSTVRVGNLATIGAGASLADDVSVGRGTVMRGDAATGVHVGPDVLIEGGAALDANARVRRGGTVRAEARLGAGAVVGRGAEVRRGAEVSTTHAVRASAIVGAHQVVSEDLGRGASLPDLGAPAGRGLWHWAQPGTAAGTHAIVGDGAREDHALGQFAAWGITRHYGDYVGRPATEPAAIGAWVSKLHAAGIEAHLVLGDPAWTDPATHAFLLGLVDQRVLTYNAGRADPAQRFDAVQLDIEPHAAADWSALDDAGRHARVAQLGDTVRMVRAHLDANGGAAIGLTVALPLWFDDLPAALGGAGPVGWPSEAARDDWFGALPVDGVAWMAYGRGALGAIVGGVETEAALVPGHSSLAIAHDGTFGDEAALWAMADAIEGAGFPADVHAYADLVPDTGIVNQAGGRRFADGARAPSCERYRRPTAPYVYVGDVGSGTYLIEPTPGLAFEVYCDMVSDEGGWTLVAKVDRQHADNAVSEPNGWFALERKPAELLDTASRENTSTGQASHGATRLAALRTAGATRARFTVIAEDDVNQRASWYKAVVDATFTSWFSSTGHTATQVCSNLAMSANCSSGDILSPVGGVAVMDGMNLSHYGFTAGELHMRLDNGEAPAYDAVCSSTGNNNGNAWRDDAIDGHWGNGLEIWLR
jgi:acyl-[acyl carrier protein]--UDP-N-acetylglucosamine O-acyltransferase